MKASTLLTLALLGTALAAGAETRTLELTIGHPDGEKPKQGRRAEPVVIDLAEAVPGMRVARATATIGGQAAPVQIDDLDGDGIADEIAMTVDLPARGDVKVTITLDSEGTQPAFVPKTNAYIKLRDEKKSHMKVRAIEFPGDIDAKATYNSIYGHGAIMEGLHNALRIYMDNRQSIDLYGKSTPRMELEETDFYTTPEQLAQGYGRDILWAGKSVAAGSFRGYRDEPVTIDSVESRGQRVIVSGPVRSIVEVDDRGWTFNGTPHRMTQRYTIWAGRHDFDVEVRVSDVTAADRFCTGIQKLETDNQGYLDAAGTAGSYGVNVPEKKFPELTEALGLGLWVDPACVAGAKEDDYNYLVMLAPDTEGVMRYSVNIGAAREADGYKTWDDWSRHLKEEWVPTKSRPVKVKINKTK